MYRRTGARFNRGRIATTAAAGGATADLLTVAQSLGAVLMIDPVTASSFTLSGSSVTAVIDRISGTACTVLGAPQWSATSFNGGPGFTFDGVDDLFQGTQAPALAALTGSSNLTIVEAVDQPTDDFGAYYFGTAKDTGVNANKSLGQSTTGSGRWRMQTINDAGTAATVETDAAGGVGGPVLLEYQGGTVDTLRVNRVGTSVAGTAHNPGTLIPTRWGLGGIPRATPTYSPSTCGLFLLFSRHLTDAEKDQLYAAMAAHSPSLRLSGFALKYGTTDHQFQIGGDAGYVAAFDPTARRFWRFGCDSNGGENINDLDVIQWVNVDTWLSGVSPTTIGASGGFAVWHSGIAKFIIYGGRTAGAGNGITTVWTFDPVTERLTTLTETLPVGLAAAAAAVHPASGKVYIFGGYVSPGVTVATIYAHDPVAGTITNTTATLPAVNSNIGAVWAEDVSKFFLIGGYNGTLVSPNVIWTYDPATPASNAVDTGQVLSLGLENQHGAYYSGRIYTFGGYKRDNSTYYKVIHRINTNPVSVSVLPATIYREDDDAVAFHDSVTGKIFSGPWIHSSQAADNNGPDKRVIAGFNPTTETMDPEPSLL